MPLARVLPFQRPSRGVEELAPGARVVGVDGEGRERHGTVVWLGEEGSGGLDIGAPDAPKAHLVPVVWSDPDMVDVATLRLA